MNVSTVLNHPKISFGDPFFFPIQYIKPNIIFISSKVFKVVPSIPHKVDGKWQKEKKML
jgi:hypothetical protein